MQSRHAVRRFASVLLLVFGLVFGARRSASAQIEMVPSVESHGFSLNAGVAQLRRANGSDRTFDALSNWSRDLAIAAYFGRWGYGFGPEVALLSPSPHLNSGASRLHAGDLLLDVGRINHLRFVGAVNPILGLGWGWNDLHVENQSGVAQQGAPGSFDAAISQPNTSISVHRSAAIASLSVGKQFFILQRYDGDGGMRGLFIGLRAGARLSHDLGSWSAGGRSLSGGPHSALAGPFIQFSIGPAAWAHGRDSLPPCPTC